MVLLSNLEHLAILVCSFWFFNLKYSSRCFKGTWIMWCFSAKGLFSHLGVGFDVSASVLVVFIRQWCQLAVYHVCCPGDKALKSFGH